MSASESEIRVNNLQKNAVLLAISRGRLRTTKRVNSTSVESDADPDILHVSKDIMSSDQLNAIKKLNNSITMYLKKICLPGPFRQGMFLLPVRLIDATMVRLEEDKLAFSSLVVDFMAFYEAAHRYAQADDATAATLLADNSVLFQFAASKAQLGSLWNPADYPEPQKVRDKFFFDFQIMELQTPGKLKAINKELYQRELAKIQNVWEGATEKISGVLMEEFLTLTKHMTDRLTPDEDGKPKSIRSATIRKMNDWFSLFDARNLSSDEELAKMVARARNLVNGIDIESLKDSEDIRTGLASSFQELTEEIDRAVIDRPARRMDFRD